MIRSVQSDGESGAGSILAKIGKHAESVRTLSYRLYTLCERKGWSQDAGLYDQLIRAWDNIEVSARAFSVSEVKAQMNLFGEDAPEQIELQTKKKTRKKK